MAQYMVVLAHEKIQTDYTPIFEATRFEVGPSGTLTLYTTVYGEADVDRPLVSYAAGVWESCSEYTHRPQYTAGARWTPAARDA